MYEKILYVAKQARRTALKKGVNGSQPSAGTSKRGRPAKGTDQNYYKLVALVEKAAGAPEGAAL